MEGNNDVNDYSSAKESGTENFDWVHDKNFPKKLKKNYTRFPFKCWKDIIFSPKNRQINDEGLYYQATVNKILGNDIFKDFDFHQEKNGVMDFNFKNVYKIDYDKLYKKNIKPDFYVYKIENKKFFELLKLREYMMILKNKDKIPEKVKFISILGEIKSSYSSCHINYDEQRKNYEKFIDLVNKLENDEYIILMYIYDNSFNFFRKDFYSLQENEGHIIYAYVPKLYYEDCFHSYNELLDQLKSKKERVDLGNTKFKKKRKDLEEENKVLQELLQELLSKKNTLASSLPYVLLGVTLIIMILLFYFNLIIFNK